MDDTVSCYHNFPLLESLSGVVDVSVSYLFACAIANDHTLQCEAQGGGSSDDYGTIPPTLLASRVAASRFYRSEERFSRNAETDPRMPSSA
eukprot:TRINITY_DN87215_c0_g1_i1.p1 TRINITY_DN87215_c0_g1~~TRINITY_DN87215_c0_g1_i1.p1  ORF type:complete len:103 (-),score=5.91 TRINITY_DN87215_c0_g1_i1:7-279(-)